MTRKTGIKNINILIILMLALFNFCFLGTEYYFDNAVGKWCDNTGVVFSQNIILGASVIGFLLFGVITDRLKKISRKVFSVAMIILSILCLVVIAMKISYEITLSAGIICFVIMGIAGSAACYFASIKVTNLANLAKIVGFAYGLGVCIQYINNNFIDEAYEIIAISVCVVLFGLILQLVNKVDDVWINPKEDSFKFVDVKDARQPIIALIFCVAFMTIVFSTLDNAVTLVHAAGDFNIGQWPRLILAVSGIAAGFLYDMNKRKSMPAMMYIVTILSVMAIIIIKMGGSFVIGLVIFYISAGFFVVFFMTGFMDISYYTQKPKLFAGLGRAINNLCAILVTGISVKLIETNSQMTILIVALLLFALISVCMLVYYHSFIMAENAEKLQKALDEFAVMQRKKKETDKFSLFIEEHKLTPRECDVLKELINHGEAVTEVSKKLAISRATLYRHIAKLNEKTNTDSRMALVQYYHKWNA